MQDHKPFLFFGVFLLLVCLGSCFQIPVQHPILSRNALAIRRVVPARYEAVLSLVSVIGRHILKYVSLLSEQCRLLHQFLMRGVLVLFSRRLATVGRQCISMASPAELADKFNKEHKETRLRVFEEQVCGRHLRLVRVNRKLIDTTRLSAGPFVRAVANLKHLQAVANLKKAVENYDNPVFTTALIAGDDVILHIIHKVLIPPSPHSAGTFVLRA